MIPIVISGLGTIIKRLVKGVGRLGNKRTRGDILDYKIIKNWLEY